MQNSISKRLISFLLFLSFLAVSFAQKNAPVRETIPLDNGWRFLTGNLVGAQEPNYNDIDWTEVHLPHDWLIAEPYNPEAKASQGYLHRRQIGWYRRHLSCSPDDLKKRTIIRFDGVYRESEVWINGQSLGKRPNGYISFSYDLTPYLRSGDNTIAVRADISGEFMDRWYSGAGIYRRVWLEKMGDVAIAPWGIFVTTPKISSTKAEVDLSVNIVNHTEHTVNVEAITRILDVEGKVVSTIKAGTQIQANNKIEISGKSIVNNPVLWSPDQPYLYSAQTTIYANGQPTDEVFTTFGIRSLRFTSKRGFELNGVETKMKGVCLHHDAGCLGAAFYEKSWERRLLKLKELGCNAIRTSHNPADPVFLDLCDRLGFLVVNEAFDKWTSKSSWYTPFFEEWSQRDLSDFVLRDRNHPSVVVWSVGNEVTEQRDLDVMDRMLPPLVACVKKLDITRPVTLALEPHLWPAELRTSSAEEKVRRVMSIAKHLDLLGANYQEPWYEDYIKSNPNLVILGTENYGYYRKMRMNQSFYESQNPWFDVKNNTQVIGQFLWTGIDYLGEAVGLWPVKGWSAALIDASGHIKPRAYLQQSLWSQKPMVRLAVLSENEPNQLEGLPWSTPRLADHWTLKDAVSTMVRVVSFSNCEEVELIVNDVTVGKQRPADMKNQTIIWNVPWRPGTLVARGYIGGKQVAEHELKTAEAPSHIEVFVDRPELIADGQDLCHVEVRIVDKNGTVVPSASNQIGFDIEGPVKLIGVDNGDLTSDESYQTNRRMAFQGKCMAVLRAGFASGDSELLITCKGLPSKKIKILCR